MLFEVREALGRTCGAPSSVSFELRRTVQRETRRVLGFATSLNETRRVLLGSVANADRSPIGRGTQRTSRIRKVTRISCIYLIYAYF